MANDGPFLFYSALYGRPVLDPDGNAGGEKGVRVEDYPYSRLDVVSGCIFTDVVAFFIIVACAATLHAGGVAIETAADAAQALRPLAGAYCAALFAFGLFNASLFSASVLPLATAYSVCEALGRA